MLRFICTIVLLITTSPICLSENGDRAVVRIFSHGCSGVAIKTGSERTYILTCSHGNIRFGTVGCDGPVQPLARMSLSKATVIKVDERLDLALVVIGNGPFAVAPVGVGTPPRRLLSVGYAEMNRWQTHIASTRLNDSLRRIETAPGPIPGMSGGGLLGPQGQLWGITQLTSPGRRRGVYIGVATINSFLLGTPCQTSPKTLFYSPQFGSSPPSFC